MSTESSGIGKVNWSDGYVEEILTLLDLIELQDDASLAVQRHDIAKNHGFKVTYGDDISGLIN